jgi:hypothetical protein
MAMAHSSPNGQNRNSIGLGHYQYKICDRWYPHFLYCKFGFCDFGHIMAMVVSSPRRPRVQNMGYLGLGQRQREISDLLSTIKLYFGNLGF